VRSAEYVSVTLSPYPSAKVGSMLPYTVDWYGRLRGCSVMRRFPLPADDPDPNLSEQFSDSGLKYFYRERPPSLIIPFSLAR